MPSPNLIAGTNDGVVPVYEPNARWCFWEIDEIFTGTAGVNRYVPKVGDYVIDRNNFITYEVTAINPATFVATLVIKTPATNSGGMNDDDLLLGVGPGYQSDTYRCYVDKSVVPYILCVDQRLKIGGTAASKAKIYKGTDLSSAGKIISRLYDNVGTLLSNDIPLELAAVDSHTSHAIKTVQQAYTNEDLLDGEIVTVVIFSAAGHVVSKRQLLVENTAFIPVVNSSQKYVSFISIKSPFLSGTSNTLIEFPINVPVAGLSLIGVVHYSDGTTNEFPVDGIKFSVFGLDSFLGTIPGQTIPLVLTYALEATEAAYGAVNGDGKYITLNLTMQTLIQDGAYAVKLFCYPVWQDSILGYSLIWKLMSLDRNIIYDVSNNIIFNTVTGPFDPLAYGLLQTKSVSINLRDVNSVFNSYIHTQVVDIVLVAPGTARTTNWMVGERNQSPLYGIDLFAEAQMVTINSWKLRIKNNLPTNIVWLDRLFYASKPLINLQRELVAPVPNVFVIKCGSLSQEYPLSAWNQILTVSAGLVINKTLIIEWIYRTSQGDSKVGVSALPIYDAVLP